MRVCRFAGRRFGYCELHVSGIRRMRVEHLRRRRRDNGQMAATGYEQKAQTGLTFSRAPAGSIRTLPVEAGAVSRSFARRKFLSAMDRSLWRVISMQVI